MERKEAIRGAYRMTGGNSFYDGMITCSTLSGKAVCRLVWAMNKAENDAYLEKAGFFTPPYETTASLKKRLEKRYAAVTLGTVKSMVWFVCQKAE